MPIYQVNRSQNKMENIGKKTMVELGFKETNHLEEWIANNPSCFGDGDEALLIIQKQYQGFDKTRETLDLLALDKKGRLVVIENKRNDSGTDVTWQAIKYASYCSDLTTDGIVEIYQEYLDDPKKNTSDSEEKDAKENILDFLAGTEDFDEKDLSEIILNVGFSQRIVLVAGEFRPEVTSAARFLTENGISVQCFETSLYEVDGKILFEINQIFPSKSTEELQMKIVKKNRDQAERQRKAYAPKFSVYDIGLHGGEVLYYTDNLGEMNTPITAEVLPIEESQGPKTILYNGVKQSPSGAASQIYNDRARKYGRTLRPNVQGTTYWQVENEETGQLETLKEIDERRKKEQEDSES